ncbi:MAG: Hpt domain-containing protein, partial [Chitinophagaceae bacterium]
QEQPKETTDMQLYDLSLLKELDDNQYLYDIMTMFVETSTVQVAELQDLVATKQWDKVAPAAHKLKGSTGMFQANELFKLYGKIEAAAKQGDYTTAEDLVHQAAQLYKLVEESMQNELVTLKQSLEG